MLTNFKDLRGQKVYSHEGACGKVFDVFFDDRNGMIQHIVLSLGSWPRTSKVLISPSRLNQSKDGSLFVGLRLDQLRHLPDPDSNPPVSRQNFLTAHGVLTKDSLEIDPQNESLPKSDLTEAVPPQNDARRSRFGKPEVTVFDILLRNRRREQSKGHMRSVREVMSYDVDIECGRAGTMEDVWLSTTTWQVTHLSLTLHINRRRIAVPATLIRGISWSAGTVRLSAGWGHSEDGPCLVPTESDPGVQHPLTGLPITARHGRGLLPLSVF